MVLKKRKTKSRKNLTHRRKTKPSLRNYAVLLAAELILIALLSFLFFSNFDIVGFVTYDIGDTPVSSNTLEGGYYLLPGSTINIDTPLFNPSFSGDLTNPLGGTTRFIPTRYEAGFQSFMSQASALGMTFVPTSGSPPTNNPPTITSTSISNVNAGQVYSYDVDATDAELNTLTYSVTISPPWSAGFSIDSATGIITGTAPAVTSNQIFNVVVTVFDGTSSATQTYTLTVLDTSVPDTQNPVVTITSPTNTDYSSQITQLTYTATDNGGVTTCWYSTNLGFTNSTPVGCSTGIFGVTSVEGTNTWKVYSQDAYGNVGSATVTFTITTPSGNNNNGGGGGGGSSCGNGIKTGSEQCDDDDRISGDGCSSNCRIENGYICASGNPSACTRALNVTANTFCLDGVCSSSTETYTPSDISDLAYTGTEDSGLISGGPVQKSSKLSFYIYIFIAVLLAGGTIITSLVLLRKWHLGRKLRHLEQEAVREEHHLVSEVEGEIKKEGRRFGV